MSHIKTVILKNGAEEPEPLVRAAMTSLRSLIRKNPIAFYELHELCKNPGHKLFGNTGEVLKDFRLVQPDGRVHDSLCNIVLSAVEGEGLEMTLTWPVKEG